MCRWFAYISPSEPCLLEDVLVTPKHSLAKQVHEHYLPKIFTHSLDPDQHTSLTEIARRNWFYNIDGVGVVWYTSTRSEFVSPNDPSYGSYPTHYKSLLHPLSNPTFLSLCAHTSSTTCLAHIRAALPSPTHPIPVLSPYNCHPFTRGRYALMHNGYVADYGRMRREVGMLMGADEAAWVSGDTDSEALAGVFFTVLGEETGLGTECEYKGCENLEVLKRTLERTISAILDTQKRVLEGPVTPSDLNIAVTDGRVLVCSRFRNHPTEQPPSLYVSTTAGVTLNRKYPGHPDGKDTGYADDVTRTAEATSQTQSSPTHGPHVIIASEPTTYDLAEWTLIPKNEYVMVDQEGKIVREKLGVIF